MSAPVYAASDKAGGDLGQERAPGDSMALCCGECLVNRAEAVEVEAGGVCSRCGAAYLVPMPAPRDTPRTPRGTPAAAARRVAGRARRPGRRK